MFTCIQVSLYSFARSVALTAAQEGANAQRAYGALPGAGEAKADAHHQRAGRHAAGMERVGDDVRR